MEKITLAAQPRTQLGKLAKQLRASGLIPAVLYGKNTKPVNIQVILKKFENVYDQAGSSSLVDLAIGNEKPIKVLIQDLQTNPVTDLPIHIDFYAIKMDEKITTEIPLTFINEAPAVKELEGNLIRNYDEIEVECLPADLVSEIEVDISPLKTFEDQIKIKDLRVSEKIKVLEDPEEVVALVNPPRSEEELEAMEEKGAAETEKEAVDEMEKKAEEEKANKEAEKTEKTDDEKKGKPTSSDKKK